MVVVTDGNEAEVFAVVVGGGSRVAVAGIRDDGF